MPSLEELALFVDTTGTTLISIDSCHELDVPHLTNSSSTKPTSSGATTAATKTKSQRNGASRAAVDITYEDLEQLFDMPSGQAAAHLGVGCTTFKKLCRRHNITRWPHRTRKSLREMERNLSTVGDMVCSEDERLHVLEQIKDGIGSTPTAELLKLRQKIFKAKHNIKRKMDPEEAAFNSLLL